jgi:hypothetical protein
MEISGFYKNCIERDLPGKSAVPTNRGSRGTSSISPRSVRVRPQLFVSVSARNVSFRPMYILAMARFGQRHTLLQAMPTIATLVACLSSSILSSYVDVYAL